MKNRITSYLESNNLLCSDQFGFRKNKSTLHAVADLVNRILTALDKKEKCTGVFCDLSKAFDCVDHQLLLQKLKNHGITGIPKNWFESYLTNRTQRVQINSNNVTFSSSQGKINFGVPQGSILGPILFIIYVNDLTQHITSAKSTIFADDTSLIITHESKESLHDLTSQAIKQAECWFYDNNLTLNKEKTYQLTFCHKTNLDLNIVNDKHVKFLGLYVDSALNWNVHLNKLSKKLASACFALYRMRNYCSIPKLKEIYCAYFESHLRYGIIFWGQAPYNNNIFKIQKRAIRTIFKKNKLHSCKLLFNKLDILTLPSLYIFEMLMYVKLNPSLFVNEIHHDYHTRKKQLFNSQQHNTALFEKGVLYMGKKLMNKIPESVLKSNVNIFKIRIKNMLLKNMFYLLKDFMDTSFTESDFILTS